MYSTFCKITEPSIKAKLEKNNTSVLTLIMFMRQDHIILINTYVCFYYLSFQPKQKGKQLWVLEGVLNMETKVMT